jgi:hypothetical protein
MRSSYVTLEEIAQMIKEGNEVQVIDNKSGEDLTSVTLAQIVYVEVGIAVLYQPDRYVDNAAAVGPLDDLLMGCGSMIPHAHAPCERNIPFKSLK